ncbi:MAG: aspartate carbamoyltransferase [Bacteroidales bacterium]|nr:aspartate carbamoyltransferase [Bacteroidales bacterium]
MKNKSLISITDFSTEEILRILAIAEGFEKNPEPHLLDGRIVATLFFEPSTRTRLSFESAVNRMGGRIIGFSDPNISSVSKGETLKDTIRIVSNYCDLIVMRHPLEGSSRYASEVATVPVVNAGDGANQHPTQTLLDMYSIKKTQGRLDNINIFMVGDLKYGRTVHSLLQAMSPFSPTFHFVSHPKLRLPDEYKTFLDSKGVKYYEHEQFNDLIPEADIIYMTRVQRERFTDLVEYEKTKDVYVLRNSMLDKAKPTMKILHPLPRINEINQDVDQSPKAYYFEQARNGVFARQAVITYLLGLKR